MKPKYEFPLKHKSLLESPEISDLIPDLKPCYFAGQKRRIDSERLHVQERHV